MKKYIHYSLIIFIISIFLLSSVFGKDNLFLVGRIIVIDPGHGFLDPGTSYENIYEKDINLNISKKIKKQLEKFGAKVILTRNDDYDLSSPNAYFRKKSDFDNRIYLINESNTDLYISIHLNYLLDSRYKGPQVFYDQENAGIANTIQKQLNKDLNGKRKIKKIPDNTYMYSRLKVPGVLIECGFLSNSEERSLLVTDKYQQTIAESITNGIKAIFKK